MAGGPSVVVFDVNESLSDMAPMAQRFADVGAPPQLAKLWFASLLRDGFALTASGGTESFARLGAEALRVVLEPEDLTRDLADAVDHVMSGFSALQPHPDVPDGVRALRSAGLRLVTLSNGSTQVADRLLTAAGLRGEFEALLSVEDAGVWKPGRGAYEYAASACGVPASRLVLVAVHPWDIHGATRAGLSTAWINRSGGRYPSYFSSPVLTVTALPELAQQLAG